MRVNSSPTEVTRSTRFSALPTWKMLWMLPPAVAGEAVTTLCQAMLLRALFSGLERSGNVIGSVVGIHDRGVDRGGVKLHPLTRPERIGAG
ncbi:hypothetical protein EDD40_0289 [Saccharothrix texasensis]|uniref:Uncharacterized protein n=1 Tax=Saccharothrix texasensis TaxID=103734 RepID=A0A3N1GXS3_9PSEU|nr:hypothetical protein EDD40_0289 [Saccharothrix texasensis]